MERAEEGTMAFGNLSIDTDAEPLVVMLGALLGVWLIWRFVGPRGDR